MLEFKTTSPEETSAFGKRLAKVLSAGKVVCLVGDLGAGKTLLVQGLAEGLGIAESVHSPTFTILNVYEGRFPVYHFDLYRLENAGELFDIGFYEYTEADGLSIIEWADKFPEELPAEYLWIEIRSNYENNEGSVEERVLQVRALGATYEQLCEELKQTCQFLR
ncbi:tRNA (adenosine(37)-N6)-threonylcarbamoyltransferase complex ATPase subunit type 1 TsaE [Pelosinus baikalensis]|uniref:tRNA threonylcarbamoyladenosine biosynthesis protein TsaE n=1 Tax=Pelosinus baikalensis TaxID=2892015 RepID=A0ABS8HSI5_9FIRM|nr:tRNA (adenosine(37)-N6)-threonylcarbamoyltransferase complex ATPase subunit type 1 TsaE [Pelosinus baikalensis]MCC5466132.1 tRNA (adenosine(37)-N6)-threonylcarbamoyltransferase complex ATPase subunit type 1 TsaE [Pelosinus baikalensis]